MAVDSTKQRNAEEKGQKAANRKEKIQPLPWRLPQLTRLAYEVVHFKICFAAAIVVGTF